ncbi:serine/threonine-protein kinase [Longispora sp. K20-0274]|uniref:serine/threonine-protein kinase n=1 Tax=Longispora sp. K20-0274 TaxID=3088255 RepID=UPI00399AB239
MTETQPGRLVGGRYRLIDSLGSGGFGRVWRAHDETLRTDVAVKEVWLPPAASPAEHAERLARAQREGRNASALRGHPNIVAVHDVVIEDDAPWIVMELVEGASLAQQLQDHGALTVDVARFVAAGLLAALGAAHAAGIVHRDVKPSNVMLTHDGRVLLTDFGIAVHTADTTLTAVGGLVGSMEYMPPERFNGGDAGGAGDLYSLGVTLFQATEAYSPFHRDTPTGTLSAIVLGPSPVPERAGPLTALITALMDKEPGRRPTVEQALGLLDGVGPAPTLRAEAPYPQMGPPAQEWGQPMPGPGPMPGPVLAAPRPSNTKAIVIASVAGVLGLALMCVLVIVVGKFAGGFPPGSSRTTEPVAAPTTGYSPPAASTTRPVEATTAPTKKAFDPASLNDQSTDNTPLTAAALLPDSYSDDKNVLYNRKGSGTEGCNTNYKKSHVNDALSTAHCQSVMGGTYVDKSEQILVAVWVVPLADTATAQSAYDALKDVHTGDWGILCPQSGAGSEVCQKNFSNARKAGYTRQHHRYLVSSIALYINLTEDTTADPWLDAAAKKAVEEAGPENYSGNR